MDASATASARVGRWGLLAALAAGLAACVQGVGVDVVQAGRQVQIAVTPRSSSAQPCVERLAVYQGVSDANAIWQVSRTRDDLCVSHFTLGVVPDGFTAGLRSAAPVRGVKYTVDVSGTGFMGRADFVVGDHDGRIGHG